MVELHSENPDREMQPGAYAQVDFELPTDPSVVRIPTSALIFRERGTEVATIGPNDTIELKPITLGRNLGTEIEVLSGLATSDRLVNSPPNSLSTGDQSPRCHRNDRRASVRGADEDLTAARHVQEHKRWTADASIGAGFPVLFASP